jgi:putative lipoic acid-binding regulatory protein
MISISCSGANCIRISRSSSKGRFFSITVISRQECHTCQYPLT